MIFQYFNEEAQLPAFKHSYYGGHSLRYGENPHQKGTYYGSLEQQFEKLNGKDLSYNNLVDIDGALSVIDEFNNEPEPTFAVIKHTNSCGVATRKTVKEAWEAALAGDPKSAFGGIFVCNDTIDLPTAQSINELFYEVLIAPDFEEEALEELTRKKKRIVLKRKATNSADSVLSQQPQFKTILQGVIAQDYDHKQEAKDDLEVVTDTTPTDSQIEDLLFANKVVKQLKSNAIALVKDKQLVGSGMGQTSRVDALEHAIKKARNFDLPLEGAVMASDAFFPFADSVEKADTAGIKAVIQPGGSIRDQDSIDYCNENDLAMVFTGTRHFKH
jgi:phosphoribosylaminoimidazolecarboxamide formyltransferase/IMP cyclohydrolase